MVSTLDSRLRVYYLQTRSLVCKYQGHKTDAAWICASYSYAGAWCAAKGGSAI